MRTRNFRAYRRRTANGAGIAEFGPAVFVLIIAIFFPLCDLISIGVSYTMLMVLNYNQVHEAALIDSSDALDPSGSVKKGIPDTWRNGMGHFVNMSGSPITEVTYRDGQQEAGGGGSGVLDKIVRVRTTVTCNPFLSIPFFVNVPGINAPFPLVVFQERPLENPDHAP